MTKIKTFFYSLILFFTLFTPSGLMLAWWDNLDCFDMAVEGRVSYFKPTSKTIRHAFGNGWADYELQFSKNIGWDWQIWAGVSGFSKDGKTGHARNTLQLIPINLGLKYYFPFIEVFKVHLEGAVCYSFMNVKERTEYADIHRHKSGWGGLIGGGIDYVFWENAYVSFFVEGYLQEFNFHNPAYISVPSTAPANTTPEKISVDVSGLKYGIGIGYQF